MGWLSGIYTKLAGALSVIAGFFYIGFLRDRNKAKDREIEVLQHMRDQAHKKAIIEDELEDRRRDRATSMKKAIKEKEELLESIKHEDDNPTVVTNIKRLLKHKNKD